MQPAVLRALEFDRIREALAFQTLTPLGRAAALVLTPSADAGEMQHGLDVTTEAVRLLADGGSMSIQAPEALLDTLEVICGLVIVRMVFDAKIDKRDLRGVERSLVGLARPIVVASAAIVPKL